MNWINIFGLMIVILILIPNLIYSCKNKKIQNQCTHRLMNILEQTGRYSSMFFMVFPIGLPQYGFHSASGFTIWLVCIAVFLMLYWIFWGFYFRKGSLYFAMPLAVIPSVIFILSGFLLHNWPLVLAGLIFSVGHIFVTYQNNRAG